MVSITQLLVCPAAVAGKVYKWTDENGQVHYAEQKPAHFQPKEISVPENTGAGPSNKPANSFEECKTRACQMNRYIDKNPVAKSHKTYPASSPSNSPLIINQPSDTEIIAKCKKNRDVYCDKGADEIRRIEKDKALLQEGLDRSARKFGPSRPVVPRY